MIFLSLFLILLAFFVMLNVIATQDPSKVEAAVSSLTETFAKSRLLNDAGTLSAKSGSLVVDEAFFDNVHALLHARKSWGRVKISSGDGFLTAVFERNRLFLPKTGVLTPDAGNLARSFAAAMARGSGGKPVRSIEIRVVATAAEMDVGAGTIPVPVRQAGGFADMLTRSGVRPEAVGLGLKTGNSALLEMTFYSNPPAVPGEASDG